MVISEAEAEAVAVATARAQLVGSWTATPSERRRTLLNRCATVSLFLHFQVWWVFSLLFGCC